MWPYRDEFLNALGSTAIRIDSPFIAAQKKIGRVKSYQNSGSLYMYVSILYILILSLSI